ncbi:hypothetical protein GBAR_LOCUS11590, partial [Geodia barretti]
MDYEMRVRENIQFFIVETPFHCFWRHVVDGTRSSSKRLRCFKINYSRVPKITDFCNSILKQDIVGCKITVDDGRFLLMKVLQSFCNMKQHSEFFIQDTSSTPTKEDCALNGAENRTQVFIYSWEVRGDSTISIAPRPAEVGCPSQVYLSFPTAIEILNVY